MENNSKTIRPNAKALRDYIVKGSLSVQERLGVLTVLGVVTENTSVVDRFNGLRKLRGLKLESPSAFEASLINAVENGYQEHLPLAEDADFGIVPVMEEQSEQVAQKGENESETDFHKRIQQKEVEQTKRKEDFVAQNQFKKKGEQKPLAKAMRAKGVSQDEVAASADVDKSTISRLKTGTRKPSFELLQKLADMFGDIETLFPELT